MRAIIETMYSRNRGLGGFDETLPSSALLAFVARKLAWRANALRRGYVNAYIAPGVSLQGKRFLSVGEAVSIGQGVQIMAVSHEGIHLGDRVTLDTGAILRASGGVRRLGAGITIGRRAAVGARNFIHGGGGVTIEEDVLLGPGVQIFSENHNFENPELPVIEQGEQPGPVLIGRGSWLGAGAIVVAGVTIGEGVVVAAGSVVTADVAPHTVVAGSPARVVRNIETSEARG
ncbi:acyltransferase [Nocardioides seonyuensis]|uniref:Acyltransferase n=1 Tax=Nocardioides seonyuensis TaxID=2518371 RepID=A0A4P7IF25_9ACTN|nr:acyltransferase [Nocardioides seonyuensis]QBX55869.1 acyltransferase [Nocardioides seonyuensis]